MLKNIERFNLKEQQLKEAGVNCYNPATLGIAKDEWEEAQMEAKEILKLCTCDIIYMMKGWKKSRGARLEYEVARLRGMEIVEEM